MERGISEALLEVGDRNTGFDEGRYTHSVKSVTILILDLTTISIGEGFDVMVPVVLVSSHEML